MKDVYAPGLKRFGTYSGGAEGLKAEYFEDIHLKGSQVRQENWI